LGQGPPSVTNIGNIGAYAPVIFNFEIMNLILEFMT
jgi:hypothetical protein